MFICPKCKMNFSLPTCKTCGYDVEAKNNVYQLSDHPDMIIDSTNDNYIGYEHIGAGYSGNKKYIIEERDYLIAKELSELTNDGIFLDLACGDGCYTVPTASFGTKIIAGDISNSMLSILQERAAKNNVSLHNTILCRMNALELPLQNNSIDIAVANSVLHLISNPEKVIKEIYRVLKTNGLFICFDDVPGKQEESTFNNTKYKEIVNFLYKEYWNTLTSAQIQPK